MASASVRALRATCRIGAVAAISGLVAGCNPIQSVIHPAGEDARDVATLFWAMTIGGALVWAVVMGCALYAVLGRKRPTTESFADRFVLIGGVAFPTVVLAALLVFGLSLLPGWTEADPPDLRIHVSAEQYWWRIAYETADGTRIASANEVHLPVGATAEFVLTSPDVIHSFWIPALGGKMDAIPGRTNVLRLTPTEPGIYRGVCAEFCGTSHALMAFVVEVHDPAGYAAWLEAEARPAQAAGSEAFVASGCGACHIVRGVVEQGSVGPDLTHFAGRSTMAAGTMDNTPENLATWLMAPDHIKPGVGMPSFAALPEADRAAIVTYLMGLE